VALSGVADSSASTEARSMGAARDAGLAA